MVEGKRIHALGDETSHQPPTTRVHHHDSQLAVGTGPVLGEHPTVQVHRNRLSVLNADPPDFAFYPQGEMRQDVAAPHYY